MKSTKHLISLAGLSMAASAAVLCFRMEGPTLQSHQEHITQNNTQIAELFERSDALMAQIDGEGRLPNDEEQAQLNEILAEVNRLQANNEFRMERIEAEGRQSQPQNRQTEAAPAQDDRRNETNPPANNRRPATAPALSTQTREQGTRGEIGMWGWESGAKFMQAVYKTKTGTIDDTSRNLLTRKASVNTEIGIEGAFAVPPTVATEIMTKAFDTARLASRCDIVDISGNRYEGVKDETEPYSNDGIATAWLGEREEIGKSTPNLEEYEIKLNKLGALVPFTNESLADAAQMESFVRNRVPVKMGEALDAAVYNGDGVKKPQGMLHSRALLQVAKESGQTAATIVYENIKKVWTRIHAPNRQSGRGFWVANPDVEEILMDLEFPGDGRPLYIPGNSIANQPNSMLYGREIFFSQHAPALGSVGDLGFFDPNEYFLIRKVGANPRIDTSMHVYFERDMSALRFVMRVSGQSKWSRTIDQKNSAVDRSCFVAIAERA